jgi:hypothetical protein
MLRYVNQLVVFLLELVMFGALGFYGFQKGSGTTTKYALAVILPAIAVLLWGYYAAPKSSHRLPMPYLALFRGVFFLCAAYLLYECGQKNWALLVAALAPITQAISYYSGD